MKLIYDEKGKFLFWEYGVEVRPTDFTARQIADALGVENFGAEVRSLLANVEPSWDCSARRANGSYIDLWAVAKLPDALLEKLILRSIACGLADVYELLAHPPGIRWEPGYAMCELPPDWISDAKRRKRALSPALREFLVDAKSAANWRELILAVLPKDAAFAWEEWIALAVLRDAGRLEWGRLALYLRPEIPGEVR